MINRVLIRIKVVQLLYSYFLVQNNFAVQGQPEAPTKEKRFAYALYLDYLYLMIQISESVQYKNAAPLSQTRFMKRLAADNIVKSLRGKYSHHPFPLSQAIEPLAASVKESALFKNFLKNPSDDNHIWPQIFSSLISTDRNIAESVRTYENYSPGGVDRAKEMIRRTFTDFFSSQDNVDDFQKDLSMSLRKARELYVRLLMLPVELTYQREKDLDERRHRYCTTEEDLHPNPKMIDNELVKLLSNSETLKKEADSLKISWTEQDPLLVKHLLKRIVESDLYKEYMDDPTSDLHSDCEFWRKTMRNIIMTDSDFLEDLENKSVFWNDDLDIMGEFALKTFRRFEDKTSGKARSDMDPVLPMFKDTEDESFGRELFEEVVKNRAKYRGYIDDALNTTHWESDRLAYMDVVVMMTALAEIFRFPQIPLVASLNEYIEIAKSYSTSKSGAFVNGLLASVIERLRSEGILRK